MARPSHHSDLLPGSLLGKYRIERMLGHGGMATVYLAVQEGTGLQVALKVLTFRGESAKPGGDVARFIREARLAGGIRHPHWVSVYETGYDTQSNLYFIAMERMHASLAQRLRAHGPMAEAEAIGVVEQIALALEKASEMQMVHRDIKPGNILYNAEGVYKLTDFGIAKSSRNEETQLTLREAVFGTPAYMSPEQATDARKVDARSDIYSLGTVFFELLAGERPYQGETPVQVLAQVITDAPPPDVRNKPRARHVRADTAKLVMSMMAKNPAERPQTPAELLARLRRLKSRVPYAPPAPVDGEEPAYDDSTIMDATDPPPGAAWSDQGAETERAPAPLATGAWPGSGPRTEGRAVPRTETGVVTRATQLVGAERTGTVATRIDRTGVVEPPPRRNLPTRKKKGNAAGAWFAVACIVLLGLIGFFALVAASDNSLSEFIARLLGAGKAVAGNEMAEPAAVAGPEEGDTGPEPAAVLRFVNKTGKAIRVKKTDAWEEFTVENGKEEERQVDPRSSGIAIRYWPLYTSDYDETEKTPGKPDPPPVLVAGKTKEVQLVLNRRESAPLQDPATVVFINTNSFGLRVTPTGEWDADKFPISENTNAVRTFAPNQPLAWDVEAPTRSGTTKKSFSTNAPGAGKTNYIVLRAPEFLDAPAAELPTLILDNTTNDVNVFAEWQGNKGARGNEWVAAGKTFPVPLDTGEAVTVLYFVNDTDYEEYSRANARTNNGIKAEIGNLKLQLKKRPAPVLTLHNTGRVDLDVRLEGEGMSPKKGMLNAGNSPIAFSELPNNKPMTLKWSPVAGTDSRWQGGSREVGPYGLGAKPQESIEATERTRPQIVIRNQSGRPVKAWVEDKNGKTVARKEPMEGWEEWTVSVDAGSYRVRTEGIWDKRDGEAYKGRYEKTDKTVDCQWGGRTQEVICNGLPIRNYLEEGNNSSEYDEAALMGALREAKRLVDEMGGEDIFQPEEYVQGCADALQKAKERKLALLKEKDADELMRGKRAYGEFQHAVANASYEGSNPSIRGTWDHIAATARRSQSWEQFLANY